MLEYHGVVTNYLCGHKSCLLRNNYEEDHPELILKLACPHLTKDGQGNPMPFELRGFTVSSLLALSRPPSITSITQRTQTRRARESQVLMTIEGKD